MRKPGDDIRVGATILEFSALTRLDHLTSCGTPQTKDSRSRPLALERYQTRGSMDRDEKIGGGFVNAKGVVIFDALGRPARSPALNCDRVPVEARAWRAGSRVLEVEHSLPGAQRHRGAARTIQPMVAGSFHGLGVPWSTPFPEVADVSPSPTAGCSRGR